MVMPEALAALIDEGHLPGDLAGRAMQAIMSGEATPSQMGAYLGALRVRGESAEVIAASAAVMREHAEPIPVDDVIDVVGTGGDGFDTFNVSTAAAIVVAAAGGRVAKHGNRAMSSKTGSADILEALGAKTDLGGEAVARVIDTCGFCYVFAQRFHPAMRHVGPTRREMGVRTLFNLLGPLTNPAKPRASLVGVASAGHASLIAEAFAMRGDRAIIVRSQDGLDEISPAAPTSAWVVENGSVQERLLQPANFGVQAHPLTAVAGSDAESNARAMKALFAGEQGAVHDFVVMNAAAALVVAGLAPDFRSGAELAASTLASDKPAGVLARYIALSQQESSP